jgi:hypothetical protein
MDRPLPEHPWRRSDLAPRRSVRLTRGGNHRDGPAVTVTVTGTEREIEPVVALILAAEAMRDALEVFVSACRAQYRNPGEESYWFDRPYREAITALAAGDFKQMLAPPQPARPATGPAGADDVDVF